MDIDRYITSLMCDCYNFYIKRERKIFYDERYKKIKWI